MTETPAETPKTGGEQSSAERPEAGLEPKGARPAEPVVTGKERRGMFGVHGTGDTSGYGGLRLPAYTPDINPVEGIWSLMKRSMANFAAADLDGLVRIVKRKL